MFRELLANVRFTADSVRHLQGVRVVRVALWRSFDGVRGSFYTADGRVLANVLVLGK